MCRVVVELHPITKDPRYVGHEGLCVNGMWCDVDE